MASNNISLFVESRYRVDRKRIIKSVVDVLKKQEIFNAVEVSIAVVGDRKMRKLNKKYRNLDKTTNVLSFPLSEGEGTNLPSDILRLGDVIISYPQIIRESAAEDMLVDDKIDELIIHGLMHLLGIHHEE